MQQLESWVVLPGSAHTAFSPSHHHHLASSVRAISRSVHVRPVEHRVRVVTRDTSVSLTLHPSHRPLALVHFDIVVSLASLWPPSRLPNMTQCGCRFILQCTYTDVLKENNPGDAKDEDLTCDLDARYEINFLSENGLLPGLITDSRGIGILLPSAPA